ncbi:class I SAM-dependent methyltransferase [Streptomyces sp. BI20]|uniref:class I SAM-dependent methyltransferase n=1 Tax=Streptomyces sp. BI20 TaxID=3403460 RepID=UPI003C768468
MTGTPPPARRDDVPDDVRRVALSRTFDGDAELYDRARPGYPDALFDDLAEFAGAVPGARVLEIGAGTGKATVPLVARGCRVTAVEVGANMAAVARRNLAALTDAPGTAPPTGTPDTAPPHITPPAGASRTAPSRPAPAAVVVTAAFEEWPLPVEPFDVVFAATAFHWIDPAVRMARSADALRPGGALAVVATQHVAGGTEEFFAAVQDCYERFDPATPPGLRPPAVADVDTSSHAAEAERSGRFAPGALTRRYVRDLAYSTAEYLDVLRTYSNHRTLPPAALDSLLNCVGRLIDTRFGGSVTKRYLFELRISRTPDHTPDRTPGPHARSA